MCLRPRRRWWISTPTTHCSERWGRDRARGNDVGAGGIAGAAAARAEAAVVRAVRGGGRDEGGARGLELRPLPAPPGGDGGGGAQATAHRALSQELGAAAGEDADDAAPRPPAGEGADDAADAAR